MGTGRCRWKRKRRRARTQFPVQSRKQVYAAQAKDYQLIDYATDIRTRAEIRAGELLIEMRERGEGRLGVDLDRTSMSNGRATLPLRRLSPTSASPRRSRRDGKSWLAFRPSSRR